jgi:hypothetical protein
VATVWAALGNKHVGAAGIFDRESEGGTFSYFKVKGLDISVETAIEKFKLVRKKQYQMKREAKGITSGPTTTTDTTDEQPTTKPALEWTEPVKPAFPGVKLPKSKTPPANSVIQDVAKTFGIDVRVSGQIEVVFRWGGRG